MHYLSIVLLILTYTNYSGDDSSDDEDSSSDWSGDETIATSANLDAAQDAWKGRPRQEVHFFNEREEKITAYRAMVASRSELLNEFDILNRLAQTRNDFIKKVFIINCFYYLLERPFLDRW